MKNIQSKKQEIRSTLVSASAIVDTLREPFLVLDNNLKVIFANNAFYSHFKVNKKETVGKLLFNLGNGQWKIPKLILLLKKIIPHKSSVVDFEVDHKFKTIGYRTMTLNAKKLYVSKGLVTEKQKNSDSELILLAIEDVTDRKKKYNAILSSIGDAVLACDTAGLITLFNHSSELLTGYTAAEVIGVHYNKIMKLVRERDEKPSNDFISWAMKNREKTKMANHTLLIRKDGFKVPVADSAAPIIDVNGDLIGCVVVFRDTTQERDIDRAKTDFVSLASHQLKTPSTTIEWLIETLLDDKTEPLTSRQREFLGDIHNKTEQMIKTVSTLLDVSRIELGKYAYITSPTDFKLAIRGVIEELKAAIVAKNLYLKEKFSQGKLVVSADANLLRMVAQNLITNAINYSPPNTKITVSLLKAVKGQKIDGRNLKKDSVVLVVADNGCGIPKQQQDKIFTKLFRADNARLKCPDGTGLGLYVVKSVLNNLGGSIWFVSEENKGTTFYVTIPVLLNKTKK
jgi:two-component system CheB/CheR fusion protein